MLAEIHVFYLRARFGVVGETPASFEIDFTLSTRVFFLAHGAPTGRDTNTKIF